MTRPTLTHEALQLLAGDERPDALEDFAHYGQYGPGRIDKRCLLQGQVWVDATGTPHALHEMPDAYLGNVIGYLRAQANAWRLQAAAWIVVDVLLGITSPDEGQAHLDALKTLPEDWIDRTPLMKALRAELARRGSQQC